MKDNKDNSRRKFLKLGLTVGTVAAGAGLLSALDKSGNKGNSEKVKVLTADGKIVEVDKSALKEAKIDLPAISSEARKGMKGRKFVMVIDLAKCKNARKCVDACQEGHHLPSGQEWMKVYLLKEEGTGDPYWFPKPCFHCDKPLCVSVCPVGATYKRSDGIVLVDNERCVGCKFCMTSCPYSSRVFHWKKPESEDLKMPYSPELNLPAKEGTVGKCVFCADKLRNNELPRCVKACPMGTIYFGDKNEDTITNGTETLRFSQVVKDKAAYRYLEELGTEPSVYYLPPVNRMFPFERGLEGLDEEVKDRYKNVDININKNTKE
jgi:Fe-S-cluster-containing dehydrogenase component